MKITRLWMPGTFSRSLSTFSVSNVAIKPSFTTLKAFKRSIVTSTSTEKPTLKLIPEDAWDSHMHVLSLSYPRLPEIPYEAHEATLEEARAALSRVKIPNMVLVQPSIYGNDNSCLLDALKQIGPKRGRGVVQFDPETTSDEQLQEWHNLGVRGVRLNLKSLGYQPEFNLLERLLVLYADRIRDLKWVLDLHVDMEVLREICGLIPKLDVKICIDHLGYPGLGMYHPENKCHEWYLQLLDLLQLTPTYLKLSAPYRLLRPGQPKGRRNLEDLVKALCIDSGIGQRRLVFATDWPHTRFEGYNVLPFAKQCVTWLGNADVVQRVFRDNARELWDVNDGDVYIPPTEGAVY